MQEDAIPVTVPGDPPTVVVRGETRTLQLRPFTFCWVNRCVDGFGPAEPQSVGPSELVVVELPGAG